MTSSFDDAWNNARAMIAAGDVDGAERTLAAAALQPSLPGPERDRAVRALAMLCERRGDVSLRSQQAFDDFVIRGGAGDVETRDRIRRLYDKLGVVDSSVAEAEAVALPDLPSLDGFASPKIADMQTAKKPRPQSLADVASEVFEISIDTGGEVNVYAPQDGSFDDATSADAGAAAAAAAHDVDDDDDQGADTVPAPNVAAQSPVHALPRITPRGKSDVAARTPSRTPPPSPPPSTQSRAPSPPPPSTPSRTPPSSTPPSSGQARAKAAPVPHDATPPPAPAGTPRRAGPTTGELIPAFAVGNIVKERYEVRGPLGRGGHATVLRVFDRDLDEECALKVFHNTGDDADVARFKREVSVSRKIVHENVVKLYDIGQESGFYYLTMELLDGDDLSTVLKTRQVTMGEALGWLVDACKGLQAAHVKGVVHRDVKPGNLFIERDNKLKVTDFGIAKPANALSLTSTGMFVGTPQFVSPEQVQGIDVTAAADIYSLGCVAYLLLTGTLPFRDKEMMALLMKHATAVPDPPSSRNPSLPPLLDALVVSCLEKKPSNRPESCAEMVTTLDKVRSQLR